MPTVDLSFKRDYISPITMPNDNLSILSEQRKGPAGQGEVYVYEMRRCQNFACSYETYDESEKRCPMCGRSMLGKRDFRVLGGILVGCGVILTAIGGSLLLFVGPNMPKNDPQGRGGFAIGIFVLILVGGLAAGAAGAAQMLSGKKNQALLAVMVAIFAVLALIAFVSRSLF